MNEVLDDSGLDVIFGEARTYRQWHPQAMTEPVLERLYELARLGPTSANCQPARFTFIVSTEAKERLKPCLAAGNVDKTMTADATVIVAHDLRFYELMANADMAAGFAADQDEAQSTAFRNGTLQGAYLIIAARALGLDCGPMSGFDNTKLDATFFPDGRCKSNFLINLDHGDPTGLRARAPRHDFGVACAIL